MAATKGSIGHRVICSHWIAPFSLDGCSSGISQIGHALPEGVADDIRAAELSAQTTGVRAPKCRISPGNVSRGCEAVGLCRQ